MAIRAYCPNPRFQNREDRASSGTPRSQGRDLGRPACPAYGFCVLFGRCTPHPVSVNKFLVFIDLGEVLRCKFFIMLELFAES